MSDLVKQLEEALEEARADLAVAADEKEVEAIKIRMIGRKGFLPAAMKQLPSLPKEERPQVGQVANKVKNALKEASHYPCH